MPLDGHSYLVAQGWSGKGSGLRQGAISRPLGIPQKKTLSGLGKDRDEAFPFWDHLYTVAAKTIQVKLHKDEDDCSDTDSSAAQALPALARTSTGILSNKRPATGTPASTSGSATPNTEPSTSSCSANDSRMSLMAAAKRDAARSNLYSRFFRGPVVGPDSAVADETTAVVTRNNDTLCLDRSAEDSTSEDEKSRRRKKERKTEGKNRREEKNLGKSEMKEEDKRKRQEGKGKEKENAGSFEIEMPRDERKQKRSLKDDDDAGAKVSNRTRKREELLEFGTGDASPAEVPGESDQKRSKKVKKRSSKVDVRDTRKDAERDSHGEQAVKKKNRKEGKTRRKEKAEKRRRKDKDALNS